MPTHEQRPAVQRYCEPDPSAIGSAAASQQSPRWPFGADGGRQRGHASLISDVA
jgi:hypothetical protein